MKKFLIPLILVGALALFIWSSVGFKSSSHDWMQEQIHDDLSWYSKEDLNPERLESSYKSETEDAKLVHFQIKDNQIYWKANFRGEGEDRVRKVCHMLNYARKQKRLPNVDFLLTIHDGIINGEDKNDHKFLPLFCFAKRKKIHAVLFPDPLTESFARRGRKKISRAKVKPRYYWKNKKEIAFWRGGTTGGDFLKDTWHQMPRTKLSLLTQYHPDKVDAGYTNYNPMPLEVKEEMLKCLPLANWTSHKNHLRYKYLVIADGNTCTYPRYYLGLYSGSAVFKDETEDYQWFYKALKPYKHYVPLAADFSDLPEKVLWAKEHDNEVKQIAMEGQKFVKRNLMPKHIYQYIHELLQEYASLQDEEVHVLDDMNLFRGTNKKKWETNG